MTKRDSGQNLPQRWPSHLQYLDALVYHSSVPAAVRSDIYPSSRKTGRSDGFIPRPSVAIRSISDPSHPAFGQCGLFATKKIAARTHILDYLGEVHCDDRPDSDYDLSLCRAQDGTSVGVDASRMGNEARFINDFRGVKPRPNAVFEDRRTAEGDMCMSVWSGSEAIRKGDEILISYAEDRHAPKDPYKVLGVNKDASAADIKKTYFSALQLARKYHPDTNPDQGAKDKFVEIQEAYDLLKDDKKRAAYDQYGSAAQQPGFNPDAFANGRNPFGAGGFNFQDFSASFGAGGRRGSQSQIFEELFGAFGGGRFGGAGFAENTRGHDIEVSVGISFIEACKGTSRTINVTPVVNCDTCSGSGLKPGAKRTTCATCRGTGTMAYILESGFQMATTCSTCHGTGSTVPRGSHCGTCGGNGQVRTKKSVKVDIPAGVENGMGIRVPNAGDASNSGKGQNGDLLVRVNVASSKLFRRQGVNLHHEARIPMHTALLGGRVRVPTLDGEVDVRVPAGTQQGEEMVLKSRGVPHVNGGDKGDLFVQFAVQLPRTLTKRQREILQLYADEVEGRPSVSRSESASPSSTAHKPASESRERSDSDDGSLVFDFPYSASARIPSSALSPVTPSGEAEAEERTDPAPPKDEERRRRAAA
ncbi:hypothetical protein EIP91_002377 [Steccherinum ochraceum]|uniref:DnaJ homolog 1, mitochondrial n=1 Tax=Steccherinum ochraceum TaxID=92696 RepID=A0A4R0RS42_9APHY|nr:hypothetical protein EIP91_002377 [Steccherinum ochraceum]